MDAHVKLLHTELNLTVTDNSTKPEKKMTSDNLMWVFVLTNTCACKAIQPGDKGAGTGQDSSYSFKLCCSASQLTPPLPWLDSLSIRRCGGRVLCWPRCLDNSLEWGQGAMTVSYCLLGEWCTVTGTRHDGEEMHEVRWTMTVTGSLF